MLGGPESQPSIKVYDEQVAIDSDRDDHSESDASDPATSRAPSPCVHPRMTAVRRRGRVASDMATSVRDECRWRGVQAAARGSAAGPPTQRVEISAHDTAAPVRSKARPCPVRAHSRAHSPRAHPSARRARTQGGAAGRGRRDGPRLGRRQGCDRRADADGHAVRHGRAIGSVVYVSPSPGRFRPGRNDGTCSLGPSAHVRFAVLCATQGCGRQYVALSPARFGGPDAAR